MREIGLLIGKGKNEKEGKEHSQTISYYYDCMGKMDSHRNIRADIQQKVCALNHCFPIRFIFMLLSLSPERDTPPVEGGKVTTSSSQKLNQFLMDTALHKEQALVYSPGINVQSENLISHG